MIIPVSATEGDKRNEEVSEYAWYTGKALLEHLETVDVSEDENVSEFICLFSEFLVQTMNFAASRARSRVAGFV